MTLQNDLLEKFAAAREDFVRFLGVDGVVTDGEALKEYRAPFGQMPTTATIHPSCSYLLQRSRCRRSYGFSYDVACRWRGEFGYVVVEPGARWFDIHEAIEAATAQYNWNGHVYRRFIERIKDAVDP